MEKNFFSKAVNFYNRFVNLLVIITIPIIIFTFVIAIGIILYDLRLFTAHFVEGQLKIEYEEGFKLLIRNILNLFVLIELFRVFLDVIEHHRIRKRQILEAGIVFVVREIILILFEHKTHYTEMIGYAIVLLSLGITYILMEKTYLEFLKFRSPLSPQKKEEYKSAYRKLRIRKVED
jgi:uncharacterized membrane protein (DUF373 family)